MATIIFDFDDTLFETKKLKEDIFKKTKSLGFTEKDFLLAMKGAKDEYGNFDPKRYINFYPKEFKENFTVWFEDNQYTKYVSKKIVNLLSQLSKKYKLVLLTKGNRKFQALKIHKSGLHIYFSDIFITPGPKEIFLKNKIFEMPVYFINDKDSENKVIKSFYPEFNVINFEIKKAVSIITHCALL